MASVIRKYQITDIPIAAIPHGRILKAGSQGCELMVWVQHDDDNPWPPTHEIKLMTVMTGQEFDSEGWEYVGTGHVGSFVGHVYYKIQEKTRE